MSDTTSKFNLTPNDKRLVGLYAGCALVLNLALALFVGSYSVALLAVMPVVLLLVVFLIVRRTDINRAQTMSRQDFVQQQIWTDMVSRLHTRLPITPLREGAASPDLIALLYTAIHTRKPKLMLECGSGVSTLILGYILQGLDQGAKLISLEHDAEWHKKVSDWVKLHQLQDTVTILHAPLQTTQLSHDQLLWYDTSALGSHTHNQKIDLVFVDGPPTWLHPRARTGIASIIEQYFAPQFQMIFDDALRPRDKQTVQDLSAILKLTPEWITLEKGAAVITSNNG